MKKYFYIYIAAGAILIVGVFFALNSISTLQDKVTLKEGRIMELDAQIGTYAGKLKSSDSLYKISQGELVTEKNKSNKLAADRERIAKLYEEEKNKIHLYNSSESLDYFRCQTTHFPTLVISVHPDTSYEVPTLALRLANEKFVQLDEEMADNDNLVAQTVSLGNQIGTLEGMVRNREGKILELQAVDGLKDKKIGLMGENIASLEKMVKREKRKKVWYKISTAAGIIGLGFVLLR